jgi:glucosamine kinase
MIGLGIDAGASSSRWLLLDVDGTELGSGRTGPITGHLFTAEDHAANLGRLRDVLAEALAAARPAAVVAGITGLHPGTAAADVLTDAIAAGAALPSSRVLVANDVHIAYANAFGPGEGVLVYAGTGSVAYHLTFGGEVVRAGGYGYLVDDAGGGYWIGHRGLKRTMRRADEHGHPAALPLDREIYAALGSDRWTEIVATVYGGGRAGVAALAPAVARAAAEGDEDAVLVLQEAGRELARLATIVLGRLDRPRSVAFAGGIARLSPLLTEALRTALPVSTALAVVTTEPVRAAARLALEIARAPT